MRKFLATLGVIAGLIAVASPAKAELGFLVGATALDDVTTTACTTATGQSIVAFGNGADMDMVVALEREIGSPGSGAFEVVSGFADVFPLASSALVQEARLTEDRPGGSCYRLHVTTDGGGTGQFQLVTNRPETDVFARSQLDFITKFDDFHGTVLGVAALGTNSSDLLSFGGDEAGAQVVADEEASPEGILTMTSGADDDADDAVEVTYGVNAFAALVSDGVTVVEARIASDTVASGQFALSLTEDVAVNGGEDTEHVISGGTVTDAATVSTAVGIMFSTDATTDNWQAVSTNATAIGNAAAEYELGTAPTANTYQRVRIEVDASGNAYWYINGTLEGAEPLAAATTATLMPHIAAMSTTTTAIKIDVDYLLFSAPRPSGT
jgi:hypothetical protein